MEKVLCTIVIYDKATKRSLYTTALNSDFVDDVYMRLRDKFELETSIIDMYFKGFRNSLFYDIL